MTNANKIWNKSTKCYEKSFEISSKMKFWFNIQTDGRIDYMSFVLYGQHLTEHLAKRRLIVSAAMNQKKCKINKMENFEENPNKTLIEFDCIKSFNRIDSIKNYKMTTISILAKTQSPIAVKICSTNVYWFSDSCGSPEQPLHSDRLVSKKSFVVFSCEEDFYLKPKTSQKVVCDRFGQWSHTFPRCASNASCVWPATDGTDPNLEVKYKDLNYLNETPIAEPKTIAIYSCFSTNSTEIELVGDNKRICHRGFWTGSQPKCVPIKIPCLS